MANKETVQDGKKNRQATSKSTQTYLRIAEIRDNVVTLKNGGLRAVLKTSSINFNLKSEQEQNAIIQAYQSFLNSLEFPVQILVRSKKLDIDDYIDSVRDIGDKQQNKLLQEQTYEYADYIQKLIEYADIMAKEFYVVVPYDPARAQSVSKIQSFFRRLAPKDSAGEIKRRHEEFDDLNKNLTQRINIVSSGLEACGLEVNQASTPEIIELFYNSYNPISARNAKIKDLQETDIDEDNELKAKIGVQ